MKARILYNSCAAVIIAVLPVAACSNPEQPLLAARLEPSLFTAVVGTAGTEIIPAPSVRVVSEDGSGVSGVQVSFVTSAQSELPVTVNVQSGPNGHASMGKWTLGTKRGTETVTARVKGLRPVGFFATVNADRPASIIALSGNEQTGFAGLPLLLPFRVRLLDRYSNPAGNAPVKFEVVSGEGSITPQTVSDANGVAEAGLTLGVAGANIVNVSAEDIPGVRFTATSVAHDTATALAVYELRGVLIGSIELKPFPNVLTLQRNGRFTVQMDGLTAAGEFTVSNSEITFNYNDRGYLDHLRSAGWLAISAEAGLQDVGVVFGNEIRINRCYSDECWRSTWTYKRVAP